MHLGQVHHNDPLYVLPQILAEELGQGQHRLPCGQLRALDQTLLVEDKQITTAGQHRAALLPPATTTSAIRGGQGHVLLLLSRVCRKFVYKLAEIPVLGLDVDCEERFEALADDA